MKPVQNPLTWLQALVVDFVFTLLMEQNLCFMRIVTMLVTALWVFLQVMASHAFPLQLTAIKMVLLQFTETPISQLSVFL